MPRFINVHAMNLGELETEVLRKLWINPSEDSNGFPAASAFGKYSEYRIRKKINLVYSNLVTMTRALRSWFIITLKANYTQYPVPLNCFDIGEVYYYTSPTAYSKMDVYEEDLVESVLSPGWRSHPGIPQYAYVADRNRMGVKLGVAPTPSINGTAITLSTGILSRKQGFGVIDSVSGSAAPGSAALVYVDAHGQNFYALGVVPGTSILNLTDGSIGVIASLSTTNISYDTITCVSLIEGSTNIWTPGDEMRVLGGEYNNFIEIGQLDAEWLLSPIVGQLPTPGITMAAGNLLVRGFMQPLLLRDYYQYPELNPLFHQAIADGAAAELGLQEPADSPEFAQAQVYQQSYNQAVGSLSSFASLQYKSGGVQLWSRRS
jgi:hypothetical protein